MKMDQSILGDAYKKMKWCSKSKDICHSIFNAKKPSMSYELKLLPFDFPQFVAEKRIISCCFSSNTKIRDHAISSFEPHFQ